MPLDRPPVQSCRRRRFALVHTAAGRKVPSITRDGRSLEKNARGQHFRKRHVGASGGNTGKAMSALRRIVDVALTRGQEQHCEGPNLRSAAAAASRGQVVRVREIAESGTSPLQTQTAMHDPRRAAFG